MSTSEAVLYPAASTEAPSSPGWRLVSHRLFQDKSAVVGLLVVVLFLVVAVAGPLVVTRDPTRIDTANTFASPSWEHPLGTDDVGRDEFSRIIYGARLSVITAFAVTLIVTTLGLAIGVLAGTYGRWVDMALMRVSDSVQALPGLILAIVVVGLLGRSIWALILSITLVGWPGYARVVRGMTLGVRELPFVDAARALGASRPRVMARHIIPNVLGPVAVLSTLSMGRSLLAVSGLSFLGFGVPVGTPEWGAMLAEGRAFLFSAPQLLFYPGLVITAMALACNVAGDGLRDLLDPRTRRR